MLRKKIPKDLGLFNTVQLWFLTISPTPPPFLGHEPLWEGDKSDEFLPPPRKMHINKNSSFAKEMDPSFGSMTPKLGILSSKLWDSGKQD